MFVAAVLFGAVLATFLPLMKGVAQTQRATDRQRIALREATNLLEQVATRPWADLVPESLNQLALTDTAKAHLPEATLTFDVAEQTEPIVSKRVAVQVRWLPKPGRPTESVRLVAWFPRREVRP